MLLLQAADGTLQLQASGQPLPDQALRWLRPLHRPFPSLSHIAASNQRQAATADQQLTAARAAGATLMAVKTAQADAAAAQGQAQQQLPPEADAMQLDRSERHPMHLEPAQAGPQSEHALGNAQPTAMQLDIPAAGASSQPDSQQVDEDHQGRSESMQEQQQQPVLLPSLPEALQDLAQQNVVRCDRQLMRRQEVLLAKWLPQRIEEESRQMRGAADVDDAAVSFVQQVPHRPAVAL